MSQRLLSSISIVGIFGSVVFLGGCATSRTLLDGREKSFVIVGYSTSYAWPDMLQEMLDEHSGGKRTYHVLNAVIGGSPVERWIAPQGSDTYESTNGAMIRDYFGPDALLRNDAPEAKIALCQQSLQFTRTRRGPIASQDDAEGIRIGTDALAQFAKRLHRVGINRVYIGMHIYKKPVEPEVGNERIALSELLKRGDDYVFEGPDTWTPTRDAFPKAFAEDGLHPNEYGMKIMAEGWYRTVAGSNAKQAIIDRMYARSYDVSAMMRAYINMRREAASRAKEAS